MAKQVEKLEQQHDDLERLHGSVQEKKCKMTLHQLKTGQGQPIRSQLGQPTSLKKLGQILIRTNEYESVHVPVASCGHI